MQSFWPPPGFADGHSEEWYTANYAAARDDPRRPVIVQTSVGAPKFMPGKLPQLDCLKPYGILRLPQPDFRDAYRGILDRQGPGRIASRLAALRAEHAGRPLALCCFEHVTRPGQWCHRELFAEWWLEQTGELIADLERLAQSRAQRLF